MEPGVDACFIVAYARASASSCTRSRSSSAPCADTSADASSREQARPRAGRSARRGRSRRATTRSSTGRRPRCVPGSRDRGRRLSASTPSSGDATRTTCTRVSRRTTHSSAPRTAHVPRAGGDHRPPHLRVRAVPRGDATLRAKREASSPRRAGNRVEGFRKLGEVVGVERARRRHGPSGGSQGAFLGRVQRRRARAILEGLAPGGRRSHGRLARVRVAGSRDRALQGFRVGIPRRVERIHHRRAVARFRAACRVPPAREVAETAPDEIHRREFGTVRVPRLVRLPAQGSPSPRRVGPPPRPDACPAEPGTPRAAPDTRYRRKPRGWPCLRHLCRGDRHPSRSHGHPHAERSGPRRKTRFRRFISHQSHLRASTCYPYGMIFDTIATRRVRPRRVSF